MRNRGSTELAVANLDLIEPKWEIIRNEDPNSDMDIDLGLESVSFQSLPWIVLPKEESYQT
jgi:hypothetical protein